MSKIIILDNKYCHFITEDKYAANLLRNHLSFKLAGVEYTQAYQNGWNGITYLMGKNNKFSYGLLHKAEAFLKSHQMSYTVEDQRLPKALIPELNIEENLKKCNLVPREHQIRIKNAACATDRGIIRAATGAGKSLCTALITANINKPTILYVIGLDLLDQFYNLYTKIFNEPIGYIGDGICRIERINIATIWTIGRALKMSDKDILDEDRMDEKEVDEGSKAKIIKLLQNTKVHIFDESHIIVTNTIAEIYKNINPEHMYGLSGTPFRDDNSDLLVHSFLGEQIINVSASEMIEKGVLAPPLIRFYTVPKKTINPVYMSAYKEYIVENEVRNTIIVDKTQELVDKKYKTLVLFKQVKHGNILFEKIKERGIRCDMLYGNDSLEKRNEIKEKLVKGEIDVIIASVIFDIGIDLPALSGLVLASGGASLTRTLQRIGRSIRSYPGKKNAVIIEFYDQVKFFKKHSLARYKVYCSEPGFKIFKSKEML